MTINSYRDLEVWQMAVEMVEQVYRVSSTFPKQETYGLASQIQRAAVSIPSNIAEGHARDSTREFLHHISIALGSAAELETQLIVAARLGYVNPDQTSHISDTLTRIGKMLRGLQKSLKSHI